MARPRKDKKIIDAAIGVFLESGFEKAPVREIAERAGVSKKTIYNNFEGKEELFAEALATIWGNFSHDFPEATFYEQEPEAVLRAFARQIYRLLDDPRCGGMIRILIAEGPRLPRLGEVFVAKVSRPSFLALTQYLEELAQSHRFDIPDPNVACLQFAGMVREPFVWVRLFGVTNPVDLTQEHVLEEAVRTFMARYRLPAHT